MTADEKWEYRIRVITDGMIGDTHMLGKRGIEDVSVIEAALNELADAGWEPLPTTLQTNMGRLALLLRRPKDEKAEPYY